MAPLSPRRCKSDYPDTVAGGPTVLLPPIGKIDSVRGYADAGSDPGDLRSQLSRGSEHQVGRFQQLASACLEERIAINLEGTMLDGDGENVFVEACHHADAVMSQRLRDGQSARLPLVVEQHDVGGPRLQRRDQFDRPLFPKPGKGRLATRQEAVVILAVKRCDSERSHILLSSLPRDSSPVPTRSMRRSGYPPGAALRGALAPTGPHFFRYCGVR